MQGILASESALAIINPCLSKVACIALILPISTAECEGSFSAMKRVKTAS